MGKAETATLKTESRLNLNVMEMKKVIITCIMCMIVFYSYGTSSDETSINCASIDKSELTSSISNQLSTELAYENQAMIEYYRDCTVKLRLRFIDSGGRTTCIDGEITFVGVSCGELIKQLSKQ